MGLGWLVLGAIILAQVGKAGASGELRAIDANPFRDDSAPVSLHQPPKKVLDANPFPTVAVVNDRGPLRIDLVNPFSGAVSQPAPAVTHPRPVDAANPFQR